MKQQNFSLGSDDQRKKGQISGNTCHLANLITSFRNNLFDIKQPILASQIQVEGIF